MEKENPPDDNITPFPDGKKRREMRVLRAANDGKNAREPVLNLPPAVKHLSLALILAFLAQEALPYIMDAARANAITYNLGFVPARYTGDMPFGIWGAVSPASHLFLHGGWLHLSINVISLMAFGAGLEKFLGGKKLILLYLATGLAGAALHLAVTPHSPQPVIGASGAVSGLFGALLVLLHDGGLLQGGSKTARLWPFAAVWIGTSVFFGAFGVPGTDAAIAWAAHVGGFLAGMALARRVARTHI